MKFLLFIGFSLLSSLSLQAHEYFFSFAELAYNSNEEKLEGTLMLSTHDLEEWFLTKNLAVNELEDHINDTKLIQQMSVILFSELRVKNNGQNIKFEVIGYEVLPNGMTNFYFHSEKIARPKILDITFDMMMSEIPEQQNKITYLDNEKSFTAIFTTTKKQSSIIIE